MRAAQLLFVGLASVVTSLAVTPAPVAAEEDVPYEAYRWCRCGRVPHWMTPESGTGAERGALITLAVGPASSAVTQPGEAMPTIDTAALIRFDTRFQHSRALGVRFSLTSQTLGSRPAQFPLSTGLRQGGALLAGVTRTLSPETDWYRLALNVDVEAAAGELVRPGLGMRSFDDDARLTGAVGLALGATVHPVSLRSHARYLRTASLADLTPGAIELGVGMATRGNSGKGTRRAGGKGLPLEAWADLRYRRALGGDAAMAPATEHQVAAGLNFLPRRYINRVGVELTGSHDRLADGARSDDLSMLLRVEFIGFSE